MIEAGAEGAGLGGGGSGIRTRDTVSRIHTFQACAFNHSATPPGETHRAPRSAHYSQDGAGRNGDCRGAMAGGRERARGLDPGRGDG